MEYRIIGYRIKMLLSRLFRWISSSTDRYADRLNPEIKRTEEYSESSSFESLTHNVFRDKATNTQRMNKTETRRACPIWIKTVLIILGILLGCVLLFELGSILYTSLIYPKQTEKQHELEISVALSDISKADSIAMALFKYEQKNFQWPGGHHSKFYDILRDEYGRCRFNHVEKGLALLKNAAEHGDSKAQFRLGCYYMGADYRVQEGDFSWNNKTMDGEPIDQVRSAYWLLQAAEQGHGTAMNNLALKYLDGDGVQKDIRKYYEWIIKSADSGNQYGLLNLGDIYRDGLKVESGTHQEYVGYHYDFDYEGAHKIKEYTTIVDYETLVEPDIEKAKYYWAESAKRGNKEAKKRLETIY